MRQILVGYNSLLHSNCHQFWSNILCLCSSHIPKHQLSITMVHIRNGGPFTVRLVDSSPSWQTFSLSLITLNDFVPEGLRLCAVWHIVSGILCVVMAFLWQLDYAAHLSSSPSLLCILKQPRHIFRESCIKPEVICTSFLASPTVFLALCGWNFSWSTWLWFGFNRTPIFHFLIRVWTLLIFSYTPFLFCKAQLPFPADPLTILLLSSWLRITSVNETCMGLSGAQKVTDLLYTPTDYKQTHHRWRWWHFIAFLTFLCRVQVTRVCKRLIWVIWVVWVVLKKSNHSLTIKAVSQQRVKERVCVIIHTVWKFCRVCKLTPT